MKKKRPIKMKKQKVAKPVQKKVRTTLVIPKKMEGSLKKLIVPEEKAFLMKNGKKLKSMWDLAKSLEKMSDEVFSYHVTPYKNDFSAWIYHVFTEVELARMLANEKNKKQTLLIIKEYYKK